VPQKMNMDLQTVDAASFGRSLTGFGVNLLVKETARSLEFLEQVLQFKVMRQSEDYAILLFGGDPTGPSDARDTEAPSFLLQIHADHTYSENPLPSLLPENGARGGGVELRLYDLDPDRAESRAVARGDVVLQSSADKPHGLRECFLLDPDGYCWVPSAPLDEGVE